MLYNSDANDIAQPIRIQDKEFARGLGRAQVHQSHDTLSLPNEPITRLRAKQFKEALNGLIQQVCGRANTWRPSISPNTFQINPNQIQGNLITLIKAEFLES